ncbi:hypothetical protein Tco_1056877 [Tanacetum coccineum]|uniref:Uncharacterized protein n=1 Tax=Tanacetum coccineum TaxID=301880 RepID=A0ABQ5H3S6_9ASTR
MAEQQTIKYAPQWNNMTVDNVTFQTNNMVGNFNYPPNVPAYKPIMKFLLNCPLRKAFIKCPSVVDQNFLREFWSTVVAYDPSPSTDETEQCPLREFLIKFSVLNGQRPLTLDFNIFSSLTGLDYNNGKYVANPTPKAVFGGNYSSTEQVNSIQQLLAYCIITGTEVDIGKIIYSDLVTKLLNKSRLKYISYPRFISCALQVLLVKRIQCLHFLGCKAKESEISYYDSNLTQVTGPEILGALFKKSKRHKSKNPPTKTKDLERNIQLASMGLPSTVVEGTHKSQPLPEDPATHPKDLGGNIQPLDRDLTSTISDEGTAKTTSRPEGSLGEKESGGNIPPADMEPIHPTIADLLGTGAKYQVDQTQSTRLRYQSLTKNKGKPLHEGELDTQPQVLSTYADVRAFLLSDDEAQESEEDILGADKPQLSHAPSTEASDIDSSCDDILKKYDNNLSLNERQLVKYLRKMLNALFARITEDNWVKHKEAADNYVDLKASIDDYYNENIAQRDQTDKLVEAFMSSLDKSINTINDLYKGLNIITELLKEIKNAVKDDNIINKKSVKPLSHSPSLERAQNHIQSSMSTLKEDIHSIKTMITEMYEVFKGQSPGSVTSTLVSLTFQQIIDKGKRIATESDEDLSKKLVPASTIVRPYLDEAVEVPYMINGKMCYLTDKEMQAYLDREEKLRKAAKEERLLAISKPEVIKVVQEEAKKIGLDPKKIASAKVGENFKKA